MTSLPEEKGKLMKIMASIFGMALASLLVGCATQPSTVVRNSRGEGNLQVYSCLQIRTDNLNQGSTDPIWHQHADYTVYSDHGRLIEQVNNITGHYAQSPRLLSLPAGQYIVQTLAAGNLPVKVPVTIRPGETTRLHLDNHWNPPTGIVQSELVKLPNGKPIGWTSDAE